MNVKGKTLLIAGVSGFIGTALARRALEKGMQVRGLDLAPPAAGAFTEGEFVFHAGSLTDRTLLDRIMPDVDIVVNAAAIVREDGSWELFRRVNVEGAVRLAEAARKHRARSFVQLSSVMVYGFDYPAMVKETGPFGGQSNPYCQTKIEGELALMQLHKPGAFDVTIVRPGDVYGPGSIPWVIRPLQMMKKKQFFLVDGGRGTMNHVFIDNLIDAIFLLIEKNASGRAYNVTDGDRTMFRDYFGRLASIGGFAVPRSLPYRVTKILARITSLLYKLFGLSSDLSSAAVDFVIRPHPVSTEAILSLGFSPRVSLDEGMRRTSEWLKRTEIYQSTPIPLKRKLRLALIPLVLLILYLLFWPVAIVPVVWQAPVNPGYVEAFARNERLASLQEIDLGEELGPEHIVVQGEWLYATVKSGAILRMKRDGSAREVWVRTGGRPLGFAFDAARNMIVADSVRGLLSIAPDKKVTVLADKFEGKPIIYADAVIVARNGIIYFSDASTRFGPAKYGDTFEASILDVLEHSSTGRILAYDPKSSRLSVVLTDLCFANGVALDTKEESLFIADTGNYRIIRHWIAGPLRGQTQTVFENLPGYPDNLMRGRGGKIWVGLAKPRSSFADRASGSPFVRKLTLRLPRFLWPVPKPYGHVFAFSENGKVIVNLQDPTGKYPETTGVTETEDRLYIQSLHAHKIGYMPARF
ncbi:MAG: NAD-dependent epimerase/dehydratase family protein [Leptospirales bacterium]|nr:NAD-dependent epimerase/dehydratase family protein [Leptospirales bacterium]